MKKQIRKGVFVRYIGNNKLRMELYGDSCFKVVKKEGDYFIAYLPTRYYNGEIHYDETIARISDFEVVNR